MGERCPLSRTCTFYILGETKEDGWSPWSSPCDHPCLVAARCQPRSLIFKDLPREVAFAFRCTSFNAPRGSTHVAATLSHARHSIVPYTERMSNSISRFDKSDPHGIMNTCKTRSIAMRMDMNVPRLVMACSLGTPTEHFHGNGRTGGPVTSWAGSIGGV